MDLADLHDAVAVSIRAATDDVGLRADEMRVEYVHNWGGFMNRSFRVTDGEADLHLKVTDDGKIRAGLRRWARVHRRLEERYHAPSLVRWMEIDGTPFAGLLFRRVEGAPPERVTPRLAREMGEMLAALHADAELAEEIASGDAGQSCLDFFEGSYLRRFAEDLDYVTPAPPPFVGRELLAWVADEAEALKQAARATPAFAEPARQPTHGDLWLENVLVRPDGRWTLLDWDGLAPSDPVVDLVALLGPTRREPRAPRWSDVPSTWTPPPGGRERFEVMARAALLDWVIDPLADHVGADAAPEHAAAMRAEMERIHRAALAAYRAAYG